MTDSNATYTRNVTVNEPDYINTDVIFDLVSSIAISTAGEITPANSAVYTLTLDASGQGNIDLPVPDNTGLTGYLWRVRLQDNKAPYFTLAYDGGAGISLGTLLAAAAGNVTPPDLGDALLIANNLSDVANAATARTNLGLVAGGAGDIWVEKAGDTMTGLLLLSGDAVAALGAVTKQQMEGSAALALLIANNLSDLSNVTTAIINLGLNSGGANDIWVEKAGDTMTGLLLLSGDPVAALGAATKQYVDTADALALLIANNLSDLNNVATARTNLGLVAGGAGDIWVEKAGDTMTGDLTFDATASRRVYWTAAGVAAEVNYNTASDTFGLTNFTTNGDIFITAGAGGKNRITTLVDTARVLETSESSVYNVDASTYRDIRISINTDATMNVSTVGAQDGDSFTALVINTGSKEYQLTFGTGIDVGSVVSPYEIPDDTIERFVFQYYSGTSKWLLSYGGGGWSQV